MVDVQIGIGATPLDDEIDRALEGRSLADLVVTPERLELELARIVDPADAEQVLEAADPDERVAFEVEVEVARTRNREAFEPAARSRRLDQLERWRTGGCLTGGDLESGLAVEALDDLARRCAAPT